MTKSPPLPDTDPPLNLEYPPSLRRKGPESVVIEPMGKEKSPRITLSGTHLQAGKKYVLRVVSPPEDDSESVTVKSLQGEEPIKVLGDPLEEVKPGGRKAYKILFKTDRLLRPFPTSSCATIRFRQGNQGEFTHELSLVVWPSWGNQLLWAFSTVFLTLVAPRLGQIFLSESGQVRPTADMEAQFRENSQFFLLSVAVTLGGAICCRLLGWIVYLCTRVE